MAIGGGIIPVTGAFIKGQQPTIPKHTGIVLGQPRVHNPIEIYGCREVHPSLKPVK